MTYNCPVLYLSSGSLLLPQFYLLAPLLNVVLDQPASLVGQPCFGRFVIVPYSFYFKLPHNFLPYLSGVFGVVCSLMIFSKPLRPSQNSWAYTRIKLNPCGYLVFANYWNYVQMFSWARFETTNDYRIKKVIWLSRTLTLQTFSKPQTLYLFLRCGSLLSLKYIFVNTIVKSTLFRLNVFLNILSIVSLQYKLTILLLCIVDNLQAQNICRQRFKGQYSNGFSKHNIFDEFQMWCLYSLELCSCLPPVVYLWIIHALLSTQNKCRCLINSNTMLDHIVSHMLE